MRSDRHFAAAVAADKSGSIFPRVEDLLFERLDRLKASVAPEVVLEDLFFIDRIARPASGPVDPDYRAPFLAEALEDRGFFESPDEGWEAIDLYDDVCRLFEVESYAALESVLERFRAYRTDRYRATSA